MNRLGRVVSAVCLLTLIVLPQPASATATRNLAGDKPNVVAFLLDDTNPTDGRLWSDPTLTPNLYDLFVAHGTQFDNAFGETPLCCPSRATLLTGLHTHNHGVVRNDARLFNPAENVGKELTSSGYSSMLIGKYMNMPNLLTPTQWTAAASGWSVFDVFNTDSEATPNKYFYDYSMYTKDQGTLAFGETPDDHSTHVIASRAVARLQAADPDKPVFQLLSIFNTHAPNIPVPGLESDPRWDACSNMPPWDPPNYNEDDVSDKPPYVANLPKQPYPNGWPMDGYCREMLGVDWLVGQVVDELKADGRYDNTMFVFTADNGMAWGQHRIGAEKASPYTTRVPLYYSWPARWGDAPRTIHEYVSDIDFAPTMCAVGGCTMGPYPGGQTQPDGLSLLALLDGDEDHLARDALLEDGLDSREWLAIRTTPQNALGLWHYVENQSGFIELYDEAADPWELHNIAGLPGHDALKQALHQELYALFAEGRPNNLATVTIIEDSVPDGAQDFAFSGSLGTFTLDDDANATLARKKVISGLAPGDYTLTMAKSNAWTLTAITCPFPNTVNVATGTVTFHLLQNDKRHMHVQEPSSPTRPEHRPDEPWSIQGRQHVLRTSHQEADPEARRRSCPASSTTTTSPSRTTA